MTWVQDWCIAGCQEKMFSIRLNFRFIMADAEGSISKNEQKRQLKVFIIIIFVIVFLQPLKVKIVSPRCFHIFSLGPSYRMGRVYKWKWSVCMYVRHHFGDDHYFCL